jgi:hypothetical protein
MSVDRKKDYRIYKPFKDKTTGKCTGAASNIQCKVQIDDDADIWDRRKVYAFWVGTNQTGEDANGNPSFGWKDELLTVNFKMEPNDAAEILSVIQGKKEVAGQSGGKYEGIFHENDKGNSTLIFKSVPGRGYSLRLSSKRKGADKAVVVSHTISFPEAAILAILLEDLIRLYYFWI